MSGTRGGYRPALDGVRGVFMVLFMAYHFGLTQLQGAWVGINLFFVLSAYLIVRLMVTEHERYGDVDVLAFYRRRIRRLLPALLTVLAAVALWWGVTGEGEQRRRLGGDVLGTLGYVMNWRLVAQADQYFGDAGGASPLRHAWTLAIEEQFYLVVPLVVIVLMRYVRDRRVAVLLLLAGAVASAAWTGAIGFDDASDYPRLYYGTDTRAQALLVGAALGFWLAPGRRYRPPVLPRGLVLAAGAVGVVSSVAALLLVGPYTGWMFDAGGILAFAVGSALLVLACADERPSWITRGLGWGPVAHTGRLSYGLYLWHWPIALILADALGGSGWVNVLLGSVVTYAIAHLSYTYLERPVIKGGVRGLIRTREPLVVGLVPVAVVAAGALVLASTAPAPLAPAAEAAEQEAVGPVRPLVDGQDEYVPDAPSRIGVYGDSVPYYLTERFPAESFPGVALDNFGKEGCDVLEQPVSWAVGFNRENEPPCVELKRTWPGTFEANGDEVLLVFASPLLVVPHIVDGERLWLDDPAYRDAITDRFDELRREAKGAGAQQVQIVNVPCRIPDTSRLPEELRSVVDNSPELTEEYADPEQVNAIVEGWADRHDDVALVDLDAVLCSDGYPEEVHGLPIYNDLIHFSPEATPMLWTWILGQVSRNYQQHTGRD